MTEAEVEAILGVPAGGYDSAVQDKQMQISLLIPTPADIDEQIPVDHSAALYRVARTEHKRFVALPGGHHRSVAHDPELQSESLRFIARAFARARGEHVA